MKLELPELKHKENYEQLIKEWCEYEDINETSPGALFYGENFEEFLKKVGEYRINSPKGHVDSTLFFGLMTII